MLLLYQLAQVQRVGKKKKKNLSQDLGKHKFYLFLFYISAGPRLNVMSHFNRVLCPAASAVLYEAKHDPVFTHPPSQ